MAREGLDDRAFGLEIPPPAGAVLQGERSDATGVHQPLTDVAYLILGYVAASPHGIHGYRLGRMLAQAPFCIPGLRASKLYRALRRLERVGLVHCRVESESARLRYRFSITPKGTAALRRWLTAISGEPGTVCQDLLNRLRFVELLPATARTRLVDAAAEECTQALAALGTDCAAGASRGNGAGDAYTRALRARLASDRCWIEEVRALLGRVAVGPAVVTTRA